MKVKPMAIDEDRTVRTGHQLGGRCIGEEIIEESMRNAAQGCFSGFEDLAANVKSDRSSLPLLDLIEIIELFCLLV